MVNNRVERAVTLNERINQLIFKYGEPDSDTVLEYNELMNSFTPEEEALYIQALDKTNCF